MATSIQDRLIKLSPYNPGFNLYGGQIIIHVTYRQTWKILESYDDNVKIAMDDNNQYTYYYYAPSNVDFNRIFDVIDTTVKFNNEAELKRQLLIQKVNDLKLLFESEDLEILQTLEFKLKKKKVKINKELVTENTSEAEKTEEDATKNEIVNDK